MLQPVVEGMRLVECLVELMCRSRYGHRVAWDVLLAWQSVKTLLQLLSSRSLFTIPCMWESVQNLLSRTVASLNPFSASSASRAQRVPAVGGAGLQTPRAIADAPPLSSSPSATYPTAEEDGSLVRVQDNDKKKSDDEKNAFGGGPSTSRPAVPLVIPRVVSSKLAEHRHASLIMDPVAATTTTSNVYMKPAERFPVSWYDILGMLLDLYVLVRPLLLVVMGRQMYHTVQRSGIPDPLLPARGTGTGQKPAAKSDETAAGEKEEEGLEPGERDKKKESAAAIPDPMEMLQSLVLVARQQTHGPFWKPWLVFFVVDVISTLLARLVRSRRVPAVYVADADLAAVPPPVRSDDEDEAADESEEEEEKEENASSAGRSRTPNSTTSPVAGSPSARRKKNSRGRATTSSADQQAANAMSQDERRVRQCANNALTATLRDPFFTVGLKRWLYTAIMVRILKRIPLLGAVANYQLSCFLMMHQFSFMYSLFS